MTSRPLVMAVLLALAVVTIGVIQEGARFGFTDEANAARLEAQVRTGIDGKAQRIRSLAARVSREQALIVQANLSREHLANLFTRLTDLAGSRVDRPEVSTTVYQPVGPSGEYRVLAWSEGPAEMLAQERLKGPASLFVAPGPTGVRLVYLEPVEADGQRVAVVASETVPASVDADGNATLTTSFGPVTVVPRYLGAGTAGEGGFVIAGPTGAALLEVQFNPDALAAQRTAMRKRVIALAIVPLALGLVTFIGPCLTLRHRAKRFRGWFAWTVAASSVAGLAVAGLAIAVRLADAPKNLLHLVVAAGCVGSVALVSGAWWRSTSRREPSGAPVRFAAEHLSVGVMLAVVIWGLGAMLVRRESVASFQAWQSTLFPLDGEGLLGIWSMLLSEIALYWIGTAALGCVVNRWRRQGTWMWLALACWMFPTAVALAAWQPLANVPPAPAVVVLVSAAAFGWLAIRLRRYYRRSTESRRLALGFLTIALPLVAVYPLSAVIDDRSVRRTIETTYAPAVAHHPEDLRDQVTHAEQEIDRLETLPNRLAASVEGDSQLAFWVWNQTSLSRSRVSSDVELYGPGRTLVSRFALNLPDYLYRTSTQVWTGTSCSWEISGELNRVGGTEQSMLHAERGVCDRTGQVVGAVVLHVVPTDYDALPFISSPNPYEEILRVGGPGAATVPPTDLELVVYGWSLRPLFPSDARHPRWVISGAIADRLYASGEPFWTELSADDRTYNVHVSQNRAGIYAIGYPKPTAIEHLTRLAEMLALAASLFIAIQALSAAFSVATRRQNPSLRVLFNEVRTSFYRKLFLFFVLVAIVPVFVFALAFGAYMTAKFRADVEGEAKSVVSVAQRVLDEVAASEQPQAQPRLSPTDDVMVWIRQVIGQDVNLFEGSTLVATSQRDLFNSGLLPTRTLASVYRAVVLDQMPTFVGEDHLGGASYLVAAAPLQNAGSEAVLTVPLAPRQREIDREVDELNRGVLVGGVLVILLAAGLGASLATRVSDPVARLTRAARQIAAGRLDVRIQARGADELRRLIEDFNAMTEMLATQRDELARANQLKAWNEMARQVAHEIKNPLTPIQLAAEHLARVHADEKRPLGAVFDQCVGTILAQVRLLRQIASEFANFAAEPVAAIGDISLTEILGPILDSYTPGLRGRIAFHMDVAPDASRVRGDRTLLARALTNLVENAVQAMPERGALDISARTDGRHVLLTLADSGVGMDAPTLARAFEPYFSTKTGGSGLGLANAKRNVERQGGAISMTSRPGEGTTIVITLARAEALLDGSARASGPSR